MATSCCNTSSAHLDRRQEDRVVDLREAGHCDERVEGPRADHPVVHDEEPAGHELTGRSSGNSGHHRVLFVRLGEPWIDGSVGQEPEEGVARHENAPRCRVRQKLGDGGLAGARWTRDDQERTHRRILAQPSNPAPPTSPSVDRTSSSKLVAGQPREPRQYCRVVPRMVVLVNGLPAAGKSSLAPGVAAALDLPLLSKDVIKEAHADVLGADPPAGLTQRQWNRQLGAAASRAMWELLRTSAPGAVLESSWRVDVRDLVESGFRHAGVSHVAEVWCEAPPDLLRARFVDRWPSSHPIHGAAPDDHEWADMVANAEPLGLGPVLRVDTSGQIDIESVIAWCRTNAADTDG